MSALSGSQIKPFLLTVALRFSRSELAVLQTAASRFFFLSFYVDCRIRLGDVRLP